MSNWTISSSAGASGSFEKLGLSRLEDSRTSQRADRVSLIQEGVDLGAPALFPVNADVTIAKDGATWFVGRVISAPRICSSASYSLQYELAGPWWYLDRLVLQQQWKEFSAPGVSAGVSRSRLILGQANDGTRIDTGTQIRAILQYAIDNGAPLQIGAVEPSVPMLYQEARDITCAEAIKRMLGYSPDAVTFFNYAGGNPTLNIRKRSSDHAVTLPIRALGDKALATVDLIASLNITPRVDLVPTVVLLKFERTDTLDGKTVRRTFEQQYPPGVYDKFNALVSTIELSGGQTSYDKQQVTTEDIDVNDVAWWKTKLPWLNGATDITLDDGAKSPSDLPRELTDGAAPWWRKTEVKPCTVSVKISCKTGGVQMVKKPFSVQLMGTTLETQEYQQLTSSTAPETVPDGLAQSLYESMATLHYEGTVTVVEKECAVAVAVGNTLNITGGLPEWSAMNAVVQSVSRSVDNGTTTITFGPPAQLSTSDMIQLLQWSRGRVPSWRIGERTSGSPEDKPINNGPTSTAQNSVTAPSGFSQAQSYTKPDDADPTVPKKQVQVDADHLPEPTGSDPVVAKMEDSGNGVYVLKTPGDLPSGGAWAIKLRLKDGGGSEAMVSSVGSELLDVGLAERLVPVDALDTWFDVADGTKIWVAQAIASYARSGNASIDHGDGDFADQSVVVVLGGDGDQTLCKRLLGEIVSVSSVLKVKQKVTPRLRLYNTNDSSFPAIYPLPA